MRFDRENRVAVSSPALAQSAAASKNAPDLASPCCASNENSCFKENVNINKSEAPKLSLEPLQMKRKKKGGGYNLRKSLAWDRAFFTEEGVLDPLELSAISGLSCREGLPFISEDTPGDSQQDEDFIKDRKKDWSSPKLNSSSSNLMTSTSLTSHEVPTYLGGKTGSRCGDCPLPLPSPSLKRPANVNVGKAAGKELKLPKVSGLKPGNSPTCTTRSTILRANRMKHNQITQLDFSIQRHAEPKSSSKHLNNTQNALRANGLQSAHHSDENSGNSSFNRHSSITMRPVMVDKANNSGPKMISDNATKIRPQKTSEGQRYDSKNFAAPFSQNAHISGRTMHPLQNQATKPSGLRMPSPSLSFFSQPKPLVSRDLPLRDTETDVFGSQKPGNLRLLDILRRTPRMYGKLPESTVSCSKDVSSTSECVAPSHVSAVELIKPNLEQNTMHKIQDLPKKNIITRISHEEAELQKIGTEVPSQSGSGEQTIDETISSIDEPPKEKNTCNFLVLNHGSTQCAEAPDDKVQNTLKVQSDGGKTCKRDCHEPDPLKCSSWETDKRTDNENVLKKKERASEERGVSQQSGSCCSGGVKALEQRQTKAENPYFVSKLLHGDLLKESASIEVLTNNIPAGEAHIQNSVSDLNIGDSKNDINLMPEVGHDINQPRKGSEGKNICLKVEMELENSIKLNTSDRLSSEKQILLQNSQQEENVQKPPSVIPDRKDGNKVTDTKMQISLSPGRRHDSNLRREETTAEPVLSVEFDCVDNFLSSESRNSSVDTIFDCDDKSKGNSNILLNGIPDGNLSNCLPRETQRTEIDNCSPLPESRIHLLSQKDTPRKVTEEGPCIQDSSADNWLISSMSSEDSESDIDNLTGLQDIGKVVGQSPKSNMLNYCCLKQSESMAIANDEFVTENLVHSNGRLQTESHADMYSGDNPSGSMQDSVTGQNEMCLNISKSSSFSEKESPLEEERCSAHENRDLIADAITDPSRVKTFSGTIMGEVSEDINNSFSCLHPKLGPVKVEATLAPKNKHGNGHNKKSRSLILPQNAIPFSDEWLAAIEAAGEDILTRKSGAVQNSPPDKSVPEPSPWSPVKKKNNQIGPFDCTKFTAPSN